MSSVFGQELHLSGVPTGQPGLPAPPLAEDGDKSNSKKMPTPSSMQNLKHNKKCPKCGKVHGNAKRGKCRNRLQFGNGEECDYEFVVNSKRAKTADIETTHIPSLEALPDRERTQKLRQISHKFKELRAKANALATETGWTCFIMAAGALAEGPKSSKNTGADPYIQTFTLDSADPVPPTIKVAVLRHGVGGSGKELASNGALAQAQARLVFQNLKSQLGHPVAVPTASGVAMIDFETASLLGPLAGAVTGVPKAVGPAGSSMEALLSVATTPYPPAMPHRGLMPGMETLESFMARLDASKYIAVLRNEDIQMRDMLECITEQDLVQLGMPMGPRRRIMNEVNKARAAGATA